MATTNVSASIGAKTLANVDRYFTNTFETILQELLANARRAGASAVAVTLDPVGRQVVVSDDGRGMPSGEAPTLLTFGGSSNEAIVEDDEAPAGMGFFSLARRGARVRSRDWEMAVPVDAFAGRAPATLRDGLREVVGTSVAFPEPLLEEDTASILRAIAARLAASMPFACTVDGVPIERRTPLDELRSVVERTRRMGFAADVAESIVDDCQIVVARLEVAPDDGNGNAIPSLASGTSLLADVFGQVIELDPAMVHDVGDESSRWTREDALALRKGERWIWTEPLHMIVLNALGSRTLVPRLPDRGSIIATDGLTRVVAAAHECAARLLARAPRNAARTRGRRIPVRDGTIVVPPRQFVAYVPTADGQPMARRIKVVHDAGVATVDPAALSAAVDGGDMIALVAPEPDYEAVVARARDASRRGSALRKVLATTALEEGDAPPFDVVKGIDLCVDGVWVPMVRDGDLLDEFPTNVWEVVPLERLASDTAIVVDSLKVRLRTHRGQVIVGATDHLALDGLDGPLLYTTIADPAAVAATSTWVNYPDDEDPDAARNPRAETEETVLLSTRGPAGMVAHQVATLLANTEHVEPCRIEATKSSDGLSWIVRVSTADGDTAESQVDVAW